MIAAPAAAFARIDIGMIYLDEDLAPSAAGSEDGGDAERPPNPIQAEFERALFAYRARWGALPHVEIPSGPSVRQGQAGERVELLRHRLGLAPGKRFDADLARVLRDYQQTHGLPANALADAETVASLNRGADHYEKVIRINLERARVLPDERIRRFIMVDAAAATLWLYEDGRASRTMRVIVGKPDQQTPMMAARLSYAVANPYWNVPPDLTQERIATRVIAEGTGYLREKRYEVLSDWTDEAQVVDPETVDWKAVAEGREELRVRQLPGPANGMGEIKFMLPNPYGIYLHDTPDKSLFEAADRRLSAGCVRLHDARQLAHWLFEEMPASDSPDRERHVVLAEPVPVYITYFTAVPAGDEIFFRDDPYQRDPELIAQLGKAGTL